VDEVTTKAFSFWRSYFEPGTVAAIPHVTAALPALCQIDGTYEGKPLTEWILH